MVIAHLGLYTSDVGLGQWVNIIHETVCRQWFGVVSWVAMSDSRLYQWRLPEVTRGRTVLSTFLKEMDVFRS